MKTNISVWDAVNTYEGSVDVRGSRGPHSGFDEDLSPHGSYVFSTVQFLPTFNL
jgi:hypothetical protein